MFFEKIAKIANVFFKIRYLKSKLSLNLISNNIFVGEGTYGNLNIFGLRKSKVIIGKYCSFAKGVTFLTDSEHDYNLVTTYPLKTLIINKNKINTDAKMRGNIIIGNDVWLGYNALILGGVKIGDGAVIGANAVVTKDVSDYAIVAGNPARLIKYRFSASTIKKLKKIAWWDWSNEKIKQEYTVFYGKVSDFIEKYS